jgi:hypothetical protein
MLNRFSITMKEYSVALAEVLRSAEVDPNVRQMAAVQLRQYIAVHWCRQVDKFTEPEPPAEVCATAGLWYSANQPRRHPPGKD